MKKMADIYVLDDLCQKMKSKSGFKYVYPYGKLWKVQSPTIHKSGFDSPCSAADFLSQNMNPQWWI